MPKELSTLKSSQGIDFYSADKTLPLFIEALAGPSARALEAPLKSFSQKVSGPWQELSLETVHKFDGPRLENYDSNGNAIDKIWLPPPLRQLRKEVVEAGIFTNSSNLEQFLKVFLLAHLGETSVLCPLACTAGLIRCIEAVGSDFLRKNYLPLLKSAETPLAGSQFITEQDMGSDVGAMVTRAVPEGKGTWRLTGEKWFCSAIDEYFLVAARPDGAVEGTRGVAIFFVPRTLEGRPNGLRIKRLKNKLGTRELPTAEIDLEGALAYNIGPVETGFKNLMNYVLNVSRVMNTAVACGFMARSLLEAENYARQRSVFGNKMIECPMVKAGLDKIRLTLDLKRCLHLLLVSEWDRNPQKDFKSDESYWQRFLINLCKYRSAVSATDCCREAMLLLGGNGTIEDFSVLPRLYRDSLVGETWEGAHNTLMLQVARDGLKFPFKDYLEESIRKRSETLRKRGFEKISLWIDEKWKKSVPDLEKLSDPSWVAVNARKMADKLAIVLETAVYGDLILRKKDAVAEDRLLDYLV